MNFRGQMKKKHKFFRVKADLRRPRINHRIRNQNHKKMNSCLINEGMEAKDIGQCGKKMCSMYYRLVGIIYKKTTVAEKHVAYFANSLYLPISVGHENCGM